MSERLEPDALHRLVGRLLAAGLAAAAASMLVGLLLSLVERQETAHAVRPGEVLGLLLAGRPSGFMAAGLALLLATPVARVVVLVAAYARERDWRYAAIALAVLALLVLGVVVGHA